MRFSALRITGATDWCHPKMRGRGGQHYCSSYPLAETPYVQPSRCRPQTPPSLHGARLAGRIKLGVPDEYAAHVIKDILPVFTAAWPNVVLEAKTAPSYCLRDEVQRGTLQAAIMAQPRGQQADQAQVLTSTTPVWVGAAIGVSEWVDPLPLAIYAAECPYRKAIMDSLKQSGRTWRVVLESPSSQAVKACVEAGLAISLLDRARVTENMQMLDGLPLVPEHEVVFVRAASSLADEAVDLLAQSIHQHFRL